MVSLCKKKINVKIYNQKHLNTTCCLYKHNIIQSLYPEKSFMKGHAYACSSAVFSHDLFTGSKNKIITNKIEVIKQAKYCP